jgi:Uma2 family endonuclease
MNVTLPTLMTSDDFLRWCQRQERGRYELEAGRVLAMPGECVGHVVFKQCAYEALKAAIERAGAACFAMPDGLAVRIAMDRVYEPDALVARLPQPSHDALEIANAVIVVEVLSTWSIKRDLTAKVTGYALIPSIEHYLVVDPEERTVMHFRRQDDMLVPPAAPMATGHLRLDPPGIDVAVDDMLGPTPAVS